MEQDMSSADVAALWSEIEKWLGAHAPDRARELRPGASPEALEALKTTIHHELPPDYSASLRLHNGKAELSDYAYLSIDDVTDTWTRLRDLEQSGAFAKLQIDAPEAQVIQPKWWHSGWLPFAKDSGGNLLCLDLDPGINGRFGQVIRFERAMGPGPMGVNSFLEWLRAYLDALMSGKLKVDEDGFIREM
jgi:uncharacterized protein